MLKKHSTLLFFLFLSFVFLLFYRRRIPKLNTTDRSLFRVTSDRTVEILNLNRKEKYSLLFGKSKALKTKENGDYDVFSIPECEFNVTRWPITVSVIKETKDNRTVIGKWVYHSRYPESYDVDAPDSFIAIMWIEKRTESHLYVLHQFLKRLPRKWRFQIITTPSVETDLLEDEMIIEELDNGRLEFLLLDNISYISYTHYQLDKEFWRRIHGEVILNFQNDVSLCDNSSLTIDDFIQYDFVTCPWGRKNWPVRVGNTGFALRRRKVVLEVLGYNNTEFIKRKTEPNGLIYEDIVFGYIFDNTTKFKTPEFELAKKWCTYYVFSPNPVGVHKAWREFFGSDHRTLLQNCPEMQNVCLLYHSAKNDTRNVEQCYGKKSARDKK